MLTTSCPSCGSPLTFQSGAALTAVCPACQSCVVRQGDVLRDYGRVARFQRDLSPIQIGARGQWDGRSFVVTGVLRKARDRVRWNEWSVTFDDGTTGWIGEGNGQWFLYGTSEPLIGVALPRGAGGTLQVGGGHFRVMEDASAAIVAAEGQLPFVVMPGRSERYLDLREIDGPRVATVDTSDTPPTVYFGVDVTLVQLQLEGLRPFAGWSDPALVHFAGPEITNVRELRCDACGASNPVRSPGQTQHLACGYCGSVMAVDAGEENIHAELLERREKAPFAPTLKVGSRGTLQGVNWVVIGAMVRAVFDDGMEWSWTEYLLHNPYRGFAWLVEDTQRHWSFVEPVRGAVPTVDGARAYWKDETFRVFQKGEARVKHVLGEFTWEVAVGDSAETLDFVAPPRMLSQERTYEEVTWSVGRWLAAETVGKAFKLSLSAGSGVAPHQPNPYHEPARRRAGLLQGGALVGVATLLMAAAVLLPDQQPVLAHEYTLTEGANAWVTDTLELSEASVVRVELVETAAGSPDVLISFVNADNGDAWQWVGYGVDSADASLAAGRWTGRVELPTPVTADAAGGTVRVSAIRDPGWSAPAILLFLFSLAAPLAWLLDASGFETRRWSNAGG